MRLGFFSLRRRELSARQAISPIRQRPSAVYRIVSRGLLSQSHARGPSEVRTAIKLLMIMMDFLVRFDCLR